MRRNLAAFATLGLLATLPADAAVRKMFVTSASGTAKLSTWADANSQSGLAAGDEICKAAATDGGLDNPSNFRAWLSDADDDAYCRVHGLTGKKAPDKCGQLVLPEDAGPWEVSDTSVLFGGPIAELLWPDLRTLNPVYWNEFGNPIAGSSEVWTGTNFSGELDFANCDDWESEAPNPMQGTRGSYLLTGFGWTYNGASDCDEVHHLLCFELGPGDPLPPLRGWGRLAFVTSAFHGGALGDWPEAPGSATGVEAGDEICRTEATAAGLPYPESFKAWLSDDNIDAEDRFDHNGPWIRRDRVRIANSLTDLTDGALFTPINVTATGQYLNSVFVWTGTNEDGTADDFRCDEWLDGTGGSSGRYGIPNTFIFEWTDFGLFPASCDDDLRLYCFQDLPLVFGDGFESGDTLTWSSSQP